MMWGMRFRFLAIVPVLAPLAAPLSAEVRVPAIFSPHAVLQAGRPLPVFGTGTPGERVTVEFGDARAATTVAPDGRWQVELPPQAASATPRTLVIAAANRIEIPDVLVGEIWLCSGQSNMEWPLAATAKADEFIAAATDPLLRVFKVPHTTAGKPQADGPGAWAVGSPETAGNFTAVGYHLARRLRGELGVPVGILDINWGGTRIEPWIPQADAREDPALRATIDAADFRVPPPPTHPSAIWNAMGAWVAPYAIRGAAWYQGESNAGEADAYRGHLARLVRAWRKAFRDPELPFGVVQLAAFKKENPDDPIEGDWANLRESQRLVARDLPKVGLVVTLDVGDADDIHPRNKDAVGQRLFLWSLVDAYGREGTAEGPDFRGISVRGDTVEVTFTNAEGLRTRDGKPPAGFAIAGEDGRFRWASARIENDRVLVSHPEVPAPVAVRYAWQNNPTMANLVNGAGLPASGFRSD
jgi:sialate O-acetylesterase